MAKTKVNEDDTFNYQLLSRLQADCEYFLGAGNGNTNRLWAGSVEKQIAKMKELWNSFKEKPEWLTMEQIEQYEKDMMVKANESITERSHKMPTIEELKKMNESLDSKFQPYTNDIDFLLKVAIGLYGRNHPYYKPTKKKLMDAGITLDDILSNMKDLVKNFQQTYFNNPYQTAFGNTFSMTDKQIPEYIQEFTDWFKKNYV